MAFKKGQSGNPKGRLPIILPEVQKALDANKNALKMLILKKLEPSIEPWIEAIIDKGIEEGDALRFRALIILALGKGVEETQEMELAPEEKLLIETYRRRLAEQREAK